MSNKKIIVVKLEDDALADQFYSKYFIEGLQKGTVSTSNEFLCVERDDAIYKMKIAEFAFMFDPSFEHIFKIDLPLLLQEENLCLESAKYLYQWTSPVIEEIEIPYLKPFINEVKSNVKKSNNYWMKIREVGYAFAYSLELKDRKKVADRFIGFEIFSPKDRVGLGYYTDEPISRVEEAIKNGDIEEDDISSVVSEIYSYERELEEDRKKSDKDKSKRKYNPRVIGAMNLLDSSDIVDVYLNDGLNEEEFIRTKVKKTDILSLPYSALLKFLYEKNDKMSGAMKITSKDLVNSYGKSLNGAIVQKLAYYGYIEPQDLIEVYEINKALRAVKYDNILEDDELKKFYTPSVLIDMKERKTLTPEFIERYLELQDFENNEESLKKQSEVLVKELELKSKAQENPDSTMLQDDVLYFFDIGFCDLENAKKVLDDAYFERKYMSEELSVEEIFEFYKKGLVTSDLITKFYTDREILELYDSGEVDRSCLFAISDPDILIEGFCDGKVGAENLVELYLSSEKFSVEDLRDAFDLAESEVDISSYIDEKVPFEKVKELFQNLLIDYSTVLRLHIQGAIDDSQLEEIKKALDTREIFEDIHSGRLFKVVTSRESEAVDVVRPLGTRKREEKDFSLEVSLISRILGKKDVEAEPYAQIESYNSKGRQTSLNNYRVFGNEDLDGIVILQKSKRENAVYVMSAHQLMYFLHGKENENGEIVAPNRMKDKAYLRTIIGVEVIEHTKEFARNLLEASARVSKKVSEQIKLDKKHYVKDVEEMVEGLREKYFMDKAKGR